MNATDTNSTSHIKQYGNCGIINATVAMNSMEINGTVNYLDVIQQGHIVVNGSVELVTTSVTDASKVLVEGNVGHAHVEASTVAESKTVANTLNEAEGSVAWDYDENSDQESTSTLWSEVYHHTGVVSGDSKSTSTSWTVSQGVQEVAADSINVSFTEKYPDAVARILDTPYSSLSAAVNAAETEDIVMLLKNTTETSDVLIDKNIQLIGTNLGSDETPNYTTINGNGYSTGDGSKTGKSGVVISLGSITNDQKVVVKNLQLKDMGNYGSVEVSSTNNEHVNVLIENIYTDQFYRMGISVHGGNVDINSCTIDEKTIKASVGNAIQYDGYGSSTAKLKGNVTNCKIINSSQEVTKWVSGGIVIWDNVSLNVDNCTIENSDTGISPVGENNELSITNTSISNTKTGLAINKYLYEDSKTCKVTLGEGNNFNCSNKAIYVGIGQGYANNVKLNISNGIYASSGYALVLSDYASYHTSKDSFNLNNYFMEGSSISKDATFNGKIAIAYDAFELSTYEDDNYKVDILSDADITPIKVQATNCWYSNSAWNSGKGTSNQMLTDFKGVFANGWIASGEGIQIYGNLTLTENITCQMQSGSFYLYFNGNNISGGKIILNKGVSVISDKSGMSSLFDGGTITEVANADGTFTYSCN